MKILVTTLIIGLTNLSIVNAQELEKKPVLPTKPFTLASLKFIPEKVTNTFKKGKTWIIDENFALKHKAQPLNHAPFVVTTMPTEIGKIMYHTRPKVAELVRFSLITKEKKLAESIRFTTINMPTNMPMDVRLARSAEILEKQVAPNFAKGHKNLTIGQKYKTKVGPYDAAVTLGKLTLKDDSFLFMKIVTILRENNPQGLIAIMFLDPTSGKKEEIKQRLADGYAQQVLHSVRFLKKKQPSKEADTPKTEEKKP